MKSTKLYEIFTLLMQFLENDYYIPPSIEMEIILIRNNWTGEMTTYSAISFKCKSSHYIHYNGIMISRRSKGLKLTLLALSSTMT